MRSRSKVPLIEPDVQLRSVVGWETLYSVSADGRVWSMPREVIDELGRPRHIRGRWLKLQIDGKGYLMVGLHRNAATRLARVHRLVAEVWLPRPRPDQDQVNHKDRDRTNAAATNLEWCTGGENQLHGWIGREPTATHRAAAARVGASRRHLSEQQAAMVRARVAAGESKATLAREFRISESVIRAIGKGTRYMRTPQVQAKHQQRAA